MTPSEQVLGAIRRMCIADLVDLVRVLESEVAEATGAGVSLRNFGAEKVAVIRAVREVTDLGLREAQEM